MRRIDHIVLTVSDLERSRRFYHEVFDMPVIDQQTNDEVVTLRCGHQLIRLQTVGRDQKALQADKPTVGAADLCLVSGDDVNETLHHFKSYYVDVIAGPVTKYGSEGQMTSIYLRDPDQNLIEVAFYKNK
ncbi:dioxygenase [Limosilactobacillus secaliphilus]|uniref:Dioxygenase n=2 Tax=Limosilactobacillus secaliphilus TaxID=396268 RepID=A0A0R2I5U9_9LACO|nr:dioxygenase [Limosilactobacillus secaliphilus]